jgi:hypothetical protein
LSRRWRVNPPALSPGIDVDEFGGRPSCSFDHLGAKVGSILERNAERVAKYSRLVTPARMLQAQAIAYRLLEATIAFSR